MMPPSDLDEGHEPDLVPEADAVPLAGVGVRGRMLMHVGDLPANENDQPGHLEPDQRQDEHREGRIDRCIGDRAGHEGGKDDAGDLPRHGGREASDDGGAQAHMGVGQEAVQEREGGAQ